MVYLSVSFNNQLSMKLKVTTSDIIYSLFIVKSKSKTAVLSYSVTEQNHQLS